MAEVSMAGYGQPGYCKVCASDLKGELNKRLKRGDSYPTIIAWAKGKDFPISKPTLIAHKKHITDPKTTFVEAAGKNPVIKRVTHSEYLQSVIDAAAAKVAKDPDEVTIDHGLRAAQAIAQGKDRTGDAISKLVLVLMGRAPAPEIIEGEWTEVPALPAPQEEPIGTPRTA